MAFLSEKSLRKCDNRIKRGASSTGFPSFSYVAELNPALNLQQLVAPLVLSICVLISWDTICLKVIVNSGTDLIPSRKSMHQESGVSRESIRFQGLCVVLGPLTCHSTGHTGTWGRNEHAPWGTVGWYGIIVPCAGLFSQLLNLPSYPVLACSCSFCVQNSSGLTGFPCNCNVLDDPYHHEGFVPNIFISVAIPPMA